MSSQQSNQWFSFLISMNLKGQEKERKMSKNRFCSQSIAKLYHLSLMVGDDREIEPRFNQIRTVTLLPPIMHQQHSPHLILLDVISHKTHTQFCVCKVSDKK